MQLESTFRGLTPVESSSATAMLDKWLPRFERLVEQPVTLRAVVEKSPEFRVTLSLQHLSRGDVTSTATSHEIHQVVADACDKLKTQLVRLRNRRESQRYRVGALEPLP
jgi:ribosome-associated translation inhibitor RaiA